MPCKASMIYGQGLRSSDSCRDDVDDASGRRSNERRSSSLPWANRRATFYPHFLNGRFVKHGCFVSAASFAGAAVLLYSKHKHPSLLHIRLMKVCRQPDVHRLTIGSVEYMRIDRMRMFLAAGEAAADVEFLRGVWRECRVMAACSPWRWRHSFLSMHATHSQGSFSIAACPMFGMCRGCRAIEWARRRSCVRSDAFFANAVGPAHACIVLRRCALVLDDRRVSGSARGSVRNCMFIKTTSMAARAGPHPG